MIPHCFEKWKHHYKADNSGAEVNNELIQNPAKFGGVL